jgi:iron complex outermembrane receptor protein
MFNVGTGSLTPRVDWTYQSYMTNGAITAKQIHPDDIIPGYALVNLRMTYLQTDAKWSLSAGVTNLFNKFYWEQLGAATAACIPGTSTCTAAGLRPAVARVGTPGLPREWSVTFSKKF